MIYAYQAIAVLAILYAVAARAALARLRGQIKATIQILERPHD